MTLVRFDDLTLDDDLVVGGDAAITGGLTITGTLTANGSAVFPTSTWTPSIGGSATYSSQVGRYIKIGRMVYFTGNLAVTSLGTGSVDTISGLPYAEGSGLGQDVAISVAFFSGVATNVTTLFGVIVTGTSTIKFYALTAAGATTAGPANLFQNSALIRFSGCYMAAS